MGKRKKALGLNPADVFISSPSPSPTPTETIPEEAKEGSDLKPLVSEPITIPVEPEKAEDSSSVSSQDNPPVPVFDNPMISPRRGRPKKPQSLIELENEKPAAMRGLRDGEIRATFIIPIDIYNKLKSLSYWEDIPMKDIVTRVLEKGLTHIKAKPVPFLTPDEKARKLVKLLDKSGS